MPTLTNDSRFFGLDLSTPGRDLRATWQRIGNWPVFAWLVPEEPVRLLHLDGSEATWFAAQGLRPAPEGDVRPARYTAVQLPEDLVLHRRLVAPSLSDAEIADVAALDVDSASPFPPGDTVWGCSTSPASANQRRVDIALASRRQVERHLAGIAPQIGRAGADGVPDKVEVWALGGDAAPIVLRGFGEARRVRRAGTGRKLALGLLGVAALLMLAIAITPSAQLRQRAIEAVGAFDALSQRVGPLIAKREALVGASDRLSTLRDLLVDRADPLRVLDELTRVLPDDTSLLGLQIDGLRVSISGQTSNSAALMQTIGAQPGFRAVRAPTAATRPLGAAKESFNIEFALDPKAFRAPLAPETAPPSAAGGGPTSQGHAPAPTGRAALVIGGPKP